MFVRRLVKGVRSSWEASATKRRWLRAESSSAASIVEAPGQAAELVRPLVRHAPGEIARLGHLLGRLGEAPHRGERGARDDEPEGRREPDAAERDEDQDRAQPVEEASTSVSGRAIWRT